MAGRKDSIKELAVFLSGNAWSYDRLETAIRAVCLPRPRPGNPSLAIALYEKGFAPSLTVMVRKKKRRKL